MSLLGPYHDLLRLLMFGAWIPASYTQSPELCASRTLGMFLCKYPRESLKHPTYHLLGWVPGEDGTWRCQCDSASGWQKFSYFPTQPINWAVCNHRVKGLKAAVNLTSCLLVYLNVTVQSMGDFQ